MAYRRQVGLIYGNVTATNFEVAVADEELKRLDYVEVESEGHRVLCLVSDVHRKSSLSFDQAMLMPPAGATGDDKLSASVRVIGYRDGQGRIQVPRTPPRAGLPVHLAEEKLITNVLGLEAAADEGAYLGQVKGSRVPVSLNMEMLAQKHVSVLAKTGAGKSYTVGVLLEELLKANVPLVILDPHGEYGSLRNPNLDERELDLMVRFGIRPKSFATQVREYALDTTLNPEAERLVLEGLNLEGRDIVDMLGSKLSGGQVGVLYQAVKETKEFLPAYTLRDIMDAVSRNKAASKWNVLNALEILDSTKIFDIKGTPVKELVQPGRCTIINLKGVTPDIQEIVVTRIANLLWDARKRNEVPAHILVVEEAHNFCPERNVGNAISGAILRTVASEGRKFGLGLLIVSQRPAKVDKNVLSQCNTQVVLKVTNPNDLKAIVQSTEGIDSATADEVQRLPVGVALVAGGGLTTPVFVEVRPRLTRHGGKSISVLHQEIEESEEDEGEDGETAGAGGEEEEPAPPDFTELEPATVPPTATAALELRQPKPTPAWRIIEEVDAARPLPKPPSPTTPVFETPWPTHGTRTPIAVQPVATPPAPFATASPRRHWGANQAKAIRHVGVRLGAIPDGIDPQRAVEVLWELAARHDADPDARLRLYVEVADVACFDEPACIRCPLIDHCAYAQALRQERRKSLGPLQRMWLR